MNRNISVPPCLRGVSVFLRHLYAFVLILACAPAWGVRVEYVVTVRAGADTVRVAATLRDLPDGPVTMAMPVWMPGYYARTDPVAGVEGFRVTSNGAALATERVSPSLWRFSNHPGTARVEYDVRAREYGYHAEYPGPTLGHLGVYVDRDSAFLQPGAALVYVRGHADAPSTLRLNLPDGWPSTAPLPKDASGTFIAPDYHTLNDSPVQAGKYRRLALTAHDKTFEIILTGRPRVDDPTLTDVCRRVSEAAMDLFAGYVPFERYQFHLHFPPDRTRPGAGLEHGASTVIVFDGRMEAEEFRNGGARLIAHEFLHAWNVKALRPEGFLPFDYQNPPRTTSLWMVEGITDYLAHLVLARSGLWTTRQTLDAFAAQMDACRASPGRNRTSLAAASEGVWDAGGASNGFGGTSYYTKGLLAAWLLDTEIRAATGGRKSLDDAVRRMMRIYARAGKPYPPDALLTAVHEAGGVDIQETYRAAIYGTDDLPLERAAERMGARLGTAQRPDTMLGVNLKRGADGLVVQTVTRGTAAQLAGLRKGDILRTLDGAPVPTDGRPLLDGSEIGDELPLVVRRDGISETLTVTVQSRPAASLERLENPTSGQRAVWEGLFAEKAPRPGL